MRSSALRCSHEHVRRRDMPPIGAWPLARRVSLASALFFERTLYPSGHSRRSFLSFPDFLWAHRSVIPLRSGLRVFCFVGSALNNTGFPPTKQTLASDSTSLALCRAPKKTGQKEKVKTKCLIYVKWNSLGCGSPADDSAIRAWFVFCQPLLERRPATPRRV